MKFCLHTVFAFFAATAALGAEVPATTLAKSAEAPKTPIIPASEWKMIRQIAVNYDLNDEATWLLTCLAPKGREQLGPPRR